MKLNYVHNCIVGLFKESDSLNFLNSLNSLVTSLLKVISNYWKFDTYMFRLTTSTHSRLMKQYCKMTVINVVNSTVHYAANQNEFSQLNNLCRTTRIIYRYTPLNTYARTSTCLRCVYTWCARNAHKHFDWLDVGKHLAIRLVSHSTASFKEEL